MELTDGFNEAMAELEDNAGLVTWQGADYTVWPTSAVLGKDLGAGGFKLRADLTFVARKGVFPDPGPQEKQKVTYLGRDYRIDSLEKIQGETYMRFICNDPGQ